MKEIQNIRISKESYEIWKEIALALTVKLRTDISVPRAIEIVGGKELENS